MKRFSLIILSLIAISCNNHESHRLKSENEKLKQQIDSLKKEIKEYHSLELFHRAKKAVADSIIFGITEHDLNTMLCGWSAFKAYNFSHYGKKGVLYTSDCQLIDISFPNFDTLKYTKPTKNRNDNLNEFIVSKNKNITFTPNDTGMYFWNGKIIVKNPRTYMITTYLIQDSINVKN